MLELGAPTLEPMLYLGAASGRDAFYSVAKWVCLAWPVAKWVCLAWTWLAEAGPHCLVLDRALGSRSAWTCIFLRLSLDAYGAGSCSRTAAC